MAASPISDLNCPVCYNSYGEKNVPMSLSGCAHKICKICYTDYFDVHTPSSSIRSKICVLCRESFDHANEDKTFLSVALKVREFIQPDQTFPEPYPTSPTAPAASSSGETQPELPLDNLIQIKHAALQGNREALFKLGAWYERSKKKEKALHYYVAAGNLGHRKAQFQAGEILVNSFDAADISKGIIWLERSADQGCANSCLILGCLYFGGKNIKKDELKAYHYFMKGAIAGGKMSMYNLGYILVEGTSLIPKNEEEGIKWLTESANKGSEFALAKLALLKSQQEAIPPEEPPAVVASTSVVVAPNHTHPNPNWSNAEHDHQNKCIIA